MTARERRPEVLVVGAGPGGATAAVELARAGREVLVIDRAQFPREKVCGDGITPLGVASLERLGLLEGVEGAGALRIDRVRIVGPAGTELGFRLDELQPDRPRALVLQRARLDEVLRLAAVRAGARWQGGLRVERLEREAEGGRVRAVVASSDSGTVVFEPEQVVVAVGASVGLLRRSGMLRRGSESIRTVRAYFEGAAGPRDEYAFFFDPELVPGYGWVFPAPGGLSNVGLGVPTTRWSTRRPTRELFAEFVARQTEGGLLEGGRPASPLRGFPIRPTFPRCTPAGPNWVLVGEAAGLVNPVTGEGIDLALESGALAARTMEEDRLEGRADHGRYARALVGRYGALFAGLRVLRDVLLTPAASGPAFEAMRRHPALARVLVSVAQGLERPAAAFRPLARLHLLGPERPSPTGGPG